MSPVYVILLMTLLACVTFHEAAPPTRDRSRDWALANKRGGIPNRFHGNSFHSSLHPVLQQRAAMTPTGDDVIEDEDERPPTRHRLVNRDYLFTVMGMGAHHHQSQPYRFDHDRYNSHYYYYGHHHHHDVDDYDYDYYDYYDYDDYDYDDESFDDDDDDDESDADDDDESDSASEEDDRKRRVGVQKIRTAAAKRDPPTLNKLESRTESKRRTPTLSVTDHQIQSRDYLSILGMGGGHGSTGHHHDHAHYNDHYYYDDNQLDNDYLYYDYDYYYYDDDFHDGYKREVDAAKTRTAPAKRKTPTVGEQDIEQQLESLHDSQGKTPTVERSRFLQAIKRYLLADDVRRK